MTEIKAHFEKTRKNKFELKKKDREIKELKKEKSLLKQKLGLAIDSISRIENETKKQNYNSCRDLENRIQSVTQDIKKELDVD